MRHDVYDNMLSDDMPVVPIHISFGWLMVALVLAILLAYVHARGRRS